jgi:D-alanyl-D-alanine carboxypeptidase/Putative peptidoglycan binding domain
LTSPSSRRSVEPTTGVDAMTVPLLRPGQTHQAVPRLKRALVRELIELRQRRIATRIRPDSKTYGSAAVRGVKKLQEKKHLDVDGVVGKDTWRALGIDEPVVDVRPILHGVPWEPGVVPIDGNWVDEVLGKEILAERKAGRWHGRILSGYRPAWYQKRLFDAAVRKYGSEAAARKWVAPPGKSRHGKKGGQGAVDVTPKSTGAQLEAAASLFRPMDWEPWHVQIQTRGEPDEADDDVDAGFPETAAAEFEENGVTLDDVDEAIAVHLERLESDEDEVAADDEADSDEGD